MCTGVEINVKAGHSERSRISTSYVERQNLTMRMGCAASPSSRTASPRTSIEKLAHAVSLHYMHYNFARPPATLTEAANGYPAIPAIAAGVADHVWTLTEIAVPLDLVLGA